MDARDESGHYCGQRVDNGKFQCSPPDKVGYCGPKCGHCINHPIYAIQDGVYCCAADWDYERRSERERRELLPWPTGRIKQTDYAHNNERNGRSVPTSEEPRSAAAVSFNRAPATRRMTEDDVRRIIRGELVAICDKATFLEEDSLVLIPLYALKSAARGGSSIAISEER